MIAADSRDELLGALRSLDIKVLPRTKGRTKEQTERWLMAHWLATLATASGLTYPFSVVKRERPDFLVTQARFQIGIAITKASPPDWGGLSALAERECPGVLLEPAHFKPDGAPLSLDRTRALLAQEQLIPSPVTGDSRRGFPDAGAM